jgi:copper transport protein
VVLGVTASLVVTEPAKTAYHPTISASLTLLGQTVDVTAVPSGARAVDLHVYVLDASGQPGKPEEITATVSLPSKQIDALPVPLRLADPGHWRAPVSVPVAGDWRLAITIRTTAIDEATGYATLTIR